MIRKKCIALEVFFYVKVNLTRNFLECLVSINVNLPARQPPVLSPVPGGLIRLLILEHETLCISSMTTATDFSQKYRENAEFMGWRQSVRGNQSSDQ